MSVVASASKKVFQSGEYLAPKPKQYLVTSPLKGSRLNPVRSVMNPPPYPENHPRDEMEVFERDFDDDLFQKSVSEIAIATSGPNPRISC